MSGINQVVNIENNFSKEKFEEIKNTIKDYVKKDNIALNISSTTDDLINMCIDYYNGDYTDVNKNIVAVLGFSILYFILPNSLIKEIIGEKTFVRSLLIFSVSFYLLNSEIKKYRKFLEDNKVIISTEYGDIVFYRHRIKEER